MYMKWRTGNETKAYSEENICDGNRGNDVSGIISGRKRFCSIQSDVILYRSAGRLYQLTTQEPATTQADINTKDDKDTQSEAVTLNIDNENQYDGMEKPYAQGYVPTNANGSVRIVFPILSEGELRGNTLRWAAPDVGDAQTAPFVFKNYEKDIRLQTVKVNANTKEVSAYVADFTVELKGKRTNGRLYR